MNNVDDNDRESVVPHPYELDIVLSELCPESASFSTIAYDSPATTTNSVKQKHQLPPHCIICGSSSTGYHYEVPSCNGCKTFFRRTITSQKHYWCSNGGNCSSFSHKDSYKKPRICQACRFQKCVDVGMNPQVLKIASHDNSNEMLKRILQTRKPNKPKPAANQLNIAIPSSILYIDNIREDLVHHLIYLDDRINKFRHCRYNPNPIHFPALERLIEESCVLGFADKCGATDFWPLYEEPWPVEYHKTWRNRLDADIYPPHDENRKFWFVFNMLSVIEYAKTFTFFKTLSNTDKVILIRAVSMPCANLIDVFFSYANQADDIINPDGTIMLEDCGRGECANKLVSLKRAAIDPFKRNNVTREEYVLLHAMMLCQAATLDLSPHGIAVVTAEHQRLSKTLFSVCMARSGRGGPARFAALLSVSGMFEKLVQVQKDFWHIFHLPLPGGKTGVSLIDQIQ